MTMKFGTQDKDFFPSDFIEKFTLIKQMGFSSFEVDGAVLRENKQQIKKAIQETGLPVRTACGGYRGWIGDFIEEKRLNGIADLKEIITALKEVGGKGVIVPAAWGMFTYRLPPMQSPRSVKGDRAAIINSLRQLDLTAKQNDIEIYLEPLNRYQDHMINLVSDAKSIIDEGGFTNVKILGDFYHMNIEEDDISECFKQHIKQIGHIHIADNHRYQPGSGSIDFAYHFSTLKRLGYTGHITYEGRVRGDNHLAAYQKSILQMLEICEKL